MEEVHAFEFAALAQQVSAVARAHGLLAPAFRTPPRKAGAVRTLKRFSERSVVVSVAIRGRSANDVAFDMIDGVLSANEVSEDRATCRTHFLTSLCSLRQDGLRAA